MRIFQDKDWLHKKYWIEELSTYEIAKLALCSQRTIMNWMEKYKIKRRALGEHAKGKKNPMHRPEVKEFFKNLIHKKYCNCVACRRKRGEEIRHKDNCKCLKCRMQRGEFKGKNNPMYGNGLKGEKNGMFGKTVSDEEKKKRSEAIRGNKNYFYGMSGEKSPNWRGGTSFEPWGIEFNKELKEQIRKRDNYACRIKACGEIQNGRKFPIHHIDYNKNNNQPKNLITLCTPCHCKTGFNREFWMNYFMEA